MTINSTIYKFQEACKDFFEEKPGLITFLLIVVMILTFGLLGDYAWYLIVIAPAVGYIGYCLWTHNVKGILAAIVIPVLLTWYLRLPPFGSIELHGEWISKFIGD